MPAEYPVALQPDHDRDAELFRLSATCRRAARLNKTPASIKQRYRTRPAAGADLHLVREEGDGKAERWKLFHAWMLLESFPGLRAEDVPDGEGSAFELVQFTVHNGTHMDAPYHFQSKTIRGEPMMTIVQVPLDWFSRPSVKLDFRALPDGHVVSAAEVEAELKRIGHEIKPFDIVLVNTYAASCMGTDEYLIAGCGMGREATLYLTSCGVRVAGIDAWGWDAPFVHTRKRWEETHDPANFPCWSYNRSSAA